MALNHRDKGVGSLNVVYNRETRQAIVVAQAQLLADTIRSIGGKLPSDGTEEVFQRYDDAVSLLDDPGQLAEARKNFVANKQYLEWAHARHDTEKKCSATAPWALDSELDKLDKKYGHGKYEGQAPQGGFISRILGSSKDRQLGE